MRKSNATLCPTAASKKWAAARSSSAPTQITVNCELITPMYGGGVKAGEVDCKMPIRASALRGQLRFWWRLLKDASNPSLTSEDLFKAECALWGGISSTGPKASQVTLQVKADPAGRRDLIASCDNKNRIQRNFDYVLILEKGQNPRLLKEGYKFELILSLNSAATKAQQAEVMEALRWWASFGGVGARTRRGLGAVKATRCNSALTPVSEQQVKAKGGKMVLKPSASSAVDAWRTAVSRLKDFRQKPGVGRNHGPGRSHWPEPDAIRRFAGHHAPNHPVDAFPRAAFGLPIVFHFKDPSDPADHTLEPDNGNSNRMASPLILRPYFDGTAYCPLALLLPGWEKCVSVPVGSNSKSLGPAWPKATDPPPNDRPSLAAQVLPMNGRGDDALSAFMAYFK